MILEVDLASQAPNRNFAVGIEDISAFETVDDTSEFSVQVTDSIGNPVNNLNIQSPSISIVSSNPDEIFGNYPNPFGVAEGTTSFVFFMDNPGDASIKIYTLLGELVWSAEETGLDRGLYDGLIKWDGNNGAGRQVLNGVYLSVIKISYSGGSSESYRTKVAFIKYRKL